MSGTSVRRRTRLIVGLALLIGALASGWRPAQAQSDLSQQLQLFNSMTPEQQQAILQRLGGQGGIGGSSGLGSLGGSGLLGGGALNGSQAVLLQQLQLQQQRRLESQFQEASERPVLKPGDTVLVEVDILPERLGGLAGPGVQAGNQVPGLGQYNPNNPGTQAGGQFNSQSLSSINPALLNNTPLGQLGPDSELSQRLQEGPQRTIEELQAEERVKLKEMLVQIRARNPYLLDRMGQLQLPGMPSMALAGLTEDLATRRVAAEPAFEKLQIRLTRLPLAKTGKEALKPFGYELFDNSVVGLLPILNLPVPSDYIVGPGDVLQVQLFGSVNQNLTLPVSRDGHVNFPQIGPIELTGQRYGSAKAEIEARVARQMIGVHANVSMNETRTITVFVLGNANYPGSYTVSGQSTVTTALFAAGGVKPIGSLRAIQVKRQGETLRTVDLYDLLMHGNSGDDIGLQSGDVVFVPPVGTTSSIDGEVKRPAIYELQGDENVRDLIQMGGGLTPNADASSAAIVRVDAQQRRVVLNVNPTSTDAASLELRNGDLLQVARLRPQLDSGVTLQGYVYRSKFVAWHEALRLSEVIPSVDDLKPGADQHYLLIRRELPPTRRIAVRSADLAAALRAPGSAADIELLPRDTVTVFDLETSREFVIQRLMDELRLQASLGQPTEIVHVDGRVKVPGDYPLEPGMRISDLLRAGGGLDPAAYGVRAELSRYTVDNGDQRRTQVLSVDLTAVRDGDSAADAPLEPFDRLSIKQVSGWTEQDQVTLKGEVRFPGSYTIKPGETLHSVIARAGGLTDFAFAEGSVFTREELKKREQEQLDRLAERMRVSITEMALMGIRAAQNNQAEAIGVGESLITQLKAAKAVGRLVINLEGVLHTKIGSSQDVILRNGDELTVPKKRQEVMVLGEVQDATSHLYQRRMTRDDYINQSGGLTREADRKQIYVVRTDGSVDAGNRGWFHDGGSVEIHPGDAIVVPLNTERLPPLQLWQAATTILYNIAIAVAAVHSL